MKVVTYFIVLVLIVAGASFAALNAGSVHINFYWISRSLPLSLLLAIAFVLGGGIGILVSMFIIIKQKAQLFRCKRQLSSVEKELSSLRIVPIGNSITNNK